MGSQVLTEEGTKMCLELTMNFACEDIGNELLQNNGFLDGTCVENDVPVACDSLSSFFDPFTLTCGGQSMTYSYSAFMETEEECRSIDANGACEENCADMYEFCEDVCAYCWNHEDCLHNELTSYEHCLEATECEPSCNCPADMLCYDLDMPYEELLELPLGGKCSTGQCIKFPEWTYCYLGDEAPNGWVTDPCDVDCGSAESSDDGGPCGYDSCEAYFQAFPATTCDTTLQQAIDDGACTSDYIPEGYDPATIAFSLACPELCADDGTDNTDPVAPVTPVDDDSPVVLVKENVVCKGENGGPYSGGLLESAAACAEEVSKHTDQINFYRFGKNENEGDCWIVVTASEDCPEGFEDNPNYDFYKKKGFVAPVTPADDSPDTTEPVTTEAPSDHTIRFVTSTSCKDVTMSDDCRVTVDILINSGYVEGSCAEAEFTVPCEKFDMDGYTSCKGNPVHWKAIGYTTSEESCSGVTVTVTDSCDLSGASTCEKCAHVAFVQEIANIRSACHACECGEDFGRQCGCAHCDGNPEDYCGDDDGGDITDPVAPVTPAGCDLSGASTCEKCAHVAFVQEISNIRSACHACECGEGFGRQCGCAHCDGNPESYCGDDDDGGDNTDPVAPVTPA